MSENVYKIISIISGVVAVFVTYFNSKSNNREKLQNDYFEKVLILYVARYKINENVNPVTFIRKNYTRKDIYTKICVLFSR